MRLTADAAPINGPLTLPDRLTVRLQTLTLSIEVRILIGEPDITFTELKNNAFCYKIEQRYHICANTM